MPETPPAASSNPFLAFAAAIAKLVGCEASGKPPRKDADSPNSINSPDLNTRRLFAAGLTPTSSGLESNDDESATPPSDDSATPPADRSASAASAASADAAAAASVASYAAAEATAASVAAEATAAVADLAAQLDASRAAQTELAAQLAAALHAGEAAAARAAAAEAEAAAAKRALEDEEATRKEVVARLVAVRQSHAREILHVEATASASNTPTSAPATPEGVAAAASAPLDGLAWQLSRLQDLLAAMKWRAANDARGPGASPREPPLPRWTPSGYAVAAYKRFTLTPSSPRELLSEVGEGESGDGISPLPPRPSPIYVGTDKTPPGASSRLATPPSAPPRMQELLERLEPLVEALLTSKEGLQLALGADEPPLSEEGEDDGEEDDDDEDAFSPPYTPLQLPTRAQ